MNWSEQFDGYCERLDFTYWAEPINAVTNAAFLIAALVMFLRIRRFDMPLAMALVAILAAIGIGSYLFHTHATAWAALADVAPILIFILVYLYIVNHEFAGLTRFWSLIAVVLFLPYAVLITTIADRLPFFATSNFYWSVPILIFAYAYFLRATHPKTARGMVIGGAILVVSITVRSLDMPLCAAIPFGVHFLWHCLNGLMLGWMIEVYRRHRLAGAGSGG